jgi:hypothetical protein
MGLEKTVFGIEQTKTVSDQQPTSFARQEREQCFCTGFFVPVNNN